MLPHRRRHILHKRNTITSLDIRIILVQLRIHSTRVHTVPGSVCYYRRNVVGGTGKVEAACEAEDVAVERRVGALAVFGRAGGGEG